MPHDAIVLGAGPAGLGAALQIARDGGRVALVESADRVGGLCITLRRGDLAYDLGGHILFVHDEHRRAWLEELLGDGLVWVPRPVACVLDGTVVSGRYLDQGGSGAALDAGSGRSAREFLDGRFGREVVEATVRRYLEKVDGMPLERIVAERARKLLVDQYAPDGFWYPGEGIGSLMEAMADEIRRRGGDVMLGTRVRRIVTDGGRVAGIEGDGPTGPIALAGRRVVAGLPPALVAGLVHPGPPEGTLSRLAPRAAVVVYLLVRSDRVSEQAWIQVDDDRVPFARLFETANWSRRLVPQGMTVLGCECYCAPDAADPIWGLDDTTLSQACAQALVTPLGLVDSATAVAPLEVVRLARAWSLVDVEHFEEAGRPARWLSEIDGLAVAQGGDVILAIAAGEAAARSGFAPISPAPTPRG